MSEPLTQRIKEAIRTTLAAITSGTNGAWYTCHKAYRCQFWDDNMLDPSAGGSASVPTTIYAVRSGSTRWLEEGSSGQMLGNLEVFILLAQLDPAPEGREIDQAEPNNDTVADRMERDVLAALLADVTLGGLVSNVMDESGIESQDYGVSGWICREMRMVMPYRFLVSGL